VTTDQLTIEIVPRPDCATLRLRGEIDMQTAPHLREAALCGTTLEVTGLDRLFEIEHTPRPADFL